MKNIENIIIETNDDDRDKQRLSKQINFKSKIKTIFDGNSYDHAYFRFILNRNLNIKLWTFSSNDYAKCRFCN
jgi:hypothetical protein